MKKQLVWIVVVLLVFSSTGLADTWFNNLRKAEKAIKKMDWGVAEKYLREAINDRSEPGMNLKTVGLTFLDYFPYYLQGKVFYETNRFEKAKAAFDRSIAYGSIKEKEDLYSDLRLMLAECNKRLTPKTQSPKTNKPEMGAPTGTLLKGKPDAKELPKQAVTPPQRKDSVVQQLKKESPKETQRAIIKNAPAKDPRSETSATPPKQATLETDGSIAVKKLMDDGKQLYSSQQLEQAQAKFMAVNQLDAGHRDAAQWLKTVRYSITVRILNRGIARYFKGNRAASEKDLRDAVTVLAEDRRNSKAVITAYQFLAVLLIENHFLSEDPKSKQLKEARTYIKEIKTLSPDFTLDERYFSPKVVAEFVKTSNL